MNKYFPDVRRKIAEQHRLCSLAETSRRREMLFDVVRDIAAGHHSLEHQLRKHLGEVFRNLAAQKESRIEEGHLMPDHVHMLIAIPPK